MERPNALELIEAVRHFLERDAGPALQGVLRYHARVAANVLSIVARELQLGDGSRRRQYAELAQLLDSSQPAPADPEALALALGELEAELARRIRAGDADTGPWREDAVAALRRTLRERLAISDPGHR